MRNLFINQLVQRARVNKNVFLIVGDLGYKVIEPFADEFPDRFINAGVAEQNMSGLAAGLASEGFHVFTYSIANFPTYRCIEQIRNDIDYHNLPVTIVAVGGGLSYGSLGYSHHAIQDISLMRVLPNIKLLTPGDPNEVNFCLNYILDNPQPSYLRLKKAGEPNFTSKYNSNTVDGVWTEIIKSRNGKIFLTISGGLPYAFKAIEKARYKEYGIYTLPIWSMSSKRIQDKQVSMFSEIITIEDHLIDGGFGSWLLESCSRVNRRKIIIKSLSEDIIGKVGDENYLNKIGGLEL